ncbi:MAG TPA: nuclear transport factor 2 family protein [Pyrinomonadaceae bacterium]|jgi:ketosteroid isomerase-like protein
MKKTLVTYALLFGATAFAFGGCTNDGSSDQTADAGANTARPTATGDIQPAAQRQADAERELAQIEKDWAAAYVRGDAPSMERYADAETYFVDPEGGVANMSQVVEQVKSGDLKFESIDVSDVKVRVYGDTAVVSYHSKDKGTYKGEDISGDHRWLDVFVRRNGKWMAVASQGTRISQPTPATTMTPKKQG